jgi:gliding motility-associated-like protein
MTNFLLKNLLSIFTYGTILIGVAALTIDWTTSTTIELPNSTEVLSQYCAHDALLQQKLEDPVYQSKYADFEKNWYNHQNGNNSNAEFVADYTLPVVVHIVHQNGTENIADAQIFQAIQDLNDAFENVGYYDQGTGVNTQVEFCLATQDPDGNPTDGITRDDSPLTDMFLETEDIALKDLNRWNPLRYINIWVVKEINSLSFGSGVAGYAYFPTSHGQPEDGLVVEAQRFGDTQSNSAVHVHEMGHYLGLYHTFQGGCGNDDCLADGDRVCDTPPDQTTAAAPCGFPQNSCSTDVNASDPNNPLTSDEDDMIENYMDYGDLVCYSAFTAGQTERMVFSIQNIRQSLLGSVACQDPCPVGITASFTASAMTVDIGETINFTNTSTNFDGAEWDIDGVVFSNTTDASSPFNSLGTFTVTLTTTNSIDPVCSQSFSMEIIVVCPVVSNFISDNPSPIGVNETINFTNVSLNGINYEWLVNGVSQSTNLNYTQSFSVSGIYEICLVASNPLCADTSCTTVVVSETAENCNSTFIRRVGMSGTDEQAEHINPTADGDFLVTGTREDSILIMKMSPNGDTQWLRTFKITDQNDALVDVIIDSENNLVGVGVGTPNSGTNYKGLLFKYDYLNDNMLWVKEAPVNLRLVGAQILEPVVGGDYLFVTHIYNNPSPGVADDFGFVQIDRNSGNIDPSVLEAYNTAGNSDAIRSAAIYDGFVYTTGRYTDGSSSNKMRHAISKFDFMGNEQWTQLGFVAESDPARFYSRDIIIEDDKIYTGLHGDDDGTSVTNINIFLTRSDLDGNIEWVKKYDFPNYLITRVKAIYSVIDGFLILGDERSNSDRIFLLKTDKLGNAVWAKSYTGGGDEFIGGRGTDGLIEKDSFIYVMAGTNSFGNGDEDMLLIKTDWDGNIDDNCIFVEDLNVTVIDFPNPVSYDKDLINYVNPIVLNDDNGVVNNIALDNNTFCISLCAEICDNGLDDDGDGLIDCYDPDCCGDDLCSSFYYADCPIDCEYAGGIPDFELELEWTTQNSGQSWCGYNTPITGDVDGDGVPEILGKPCTFGSGSPWPNILVIDGASGNIETVITTPAFRYINSGPSIADLDGNGMVEIFFQASDNFANQNYAGNGIITGDVRRRIVCYEFDGTTYVEKWMSNSIAGYDLIEDANTVSAADFDGNGIAEIYVGNQIFNGLDGTLITEGGANNHRGIQAQNGIGEMHNRAVAYSVAVDVLPDDFCANCQGLEIVAGTAVYSVSIDPVLPSNSTINIEVEMPSGKDGRTSIADIDNDGDLDALVTSNDAANASIAGIQIWDIQTPTYLANLNNISTGDGEISQANIADFDGDGQVEFGVCNKFIYTVYEWDGANGLNTLWSIVTNDGSGQTGSTVFDFNNDGQFEVVYRDQTNLRILDGATGAELASELCSSFTRVEYPVVVDVDADGETELLCSCVGELRAYGSLNAPWVSTRSVWNQHNYFNVNINDDLSIPLGQQAHHIVGDSIVLNNFLTQYANPQFPIPDATVSIDSFGCGLDSFYVQLIICNEGDLRLTNEMPTTFYDGDPTSINATALTTVALGQNIDPDTCLTIGFYIPPIYNQAIYVVVNDDASLAGPYDLATDFPVTSIAECDYTNNIDSFILIGNPPMELDLGPDITICDNGVVELNAGSGFVSYEWQDGWADSTYTAFGEGKYWVDVIDSCGDLQSDTIEIFRLTPTIATVEPPVATFCPPTCVTFTVQGNFFDHYEWQPSDHLDCDTCKTVTACPPGDFEYILIAWTDDGCYSLDTVYAQTTSYQTEENFSVCLGGSIIIDGQPVSTPGTYIQDLTAVDGCDSIHTITLQNFPETDFGFSISPACPGADNGSASVIINSGQTPFSYNWDVAGVGDTPTIDNQSGGNYNVTITDGNDCTVVGTAVIPEDNSFEVLADVLDETCFIFGDGRIEITNPIGAAWTYSLDNMNFQSSPIFENVIPDNYTIYLTDGFCEYETQVTITAANAFEIGIDVSPSTIVEIGGSVDLQITNLPSNVDSIEWENTETLSCDDCPNPTATPTEDNTEYFVTVTDLNGCISTALIVLTFPCQADKVIIPNVFTPDGDGLNDTFGAIIGEGVEMVSSMKIFDRWGEKVFEASGNNVNWDGSVDGKPGVSDVYVYVIRVVCPEGEIQYIDDVTLLR